MDLKDIYLKNSKRLQTRIVLIVIAVTMGTGVLFSVVCTSFYSSYIRNNLIVSTDTNLEFLSNNIDSDINTALNIVTFSQSNKEIMDYLECTDPVDYPLYATKAYDRLYEDYRNNPISSYIRRIIIGNNYNRYIQVVPAIYSSNKKVAETVSSLPYFNEMLESSSLSVSCGIVDDPLYNGDSSDILPVIRPIFAKYRGERNGYIYLQIDEFLFENALSDYTPPEDVSTFLMIGDNLYTLSSSDCEIASFIPEMNEKNRIHVSGISSHAEVYKTGFDDSGKHEIVVKRKISSLPDTYLLQTLSGQERKVSTLFIFILWLVIVALMFVISIIISLYLNHSIAKPITRLQKQLIKISTGDFTQDKSLETADELGDIGKGINELSSNIEELLTQRIDAEKEKKDLEYKVLQTQINPHFLYNTLNSIKWMASVQGATGISEMTTSLSRLLRSISKGTTLQIPIKEELDLVKDYFNIQNYRYGGTIKLQINCEDASLLECQIIKFTLQPIVENAIFHGLEPKGSGTVKVNVAAIPSSSDDSVRDIDITVFDNGVGMSMEDAKKILSEKSTNRADFFKEIGISNVHQRIQYQYGEEYGISIDSVIGEYTAMHILIPAIAVDDTCSDSRILG